MILRAFLVFVLVASSNAYYVTEEECLNYTVYPVQYDLTITPYISKDKSYYNCDLTITVITNAPNIWVIELDASKDFVIFEENGITVKDGDVNIISKNRPYDHNHGTGKLYIYLQQALQQHRLTKKQYYIHISFRKLVSYDGNGIFLVPYDDGTSKFMLGTRLSPNKAKYFFPCFDNPRFESVFKFRVYVPSVNTGVQYSNTSLVIAPVQRQEAHKDYKLIEYIPSPQVALYQVGFHYSQFGHREAKMKVRSNNTLVTWAIPHKMEYYDFILRFGERIIDLIQYYSGRDVSKIIGPINLVAVPSNLDGYEVGSWKLLTNGDTRLAYVPQYTSAKQQEIMMFQLAQHLCRIWLGNPGEVQKTRWQEEWFREGMATYLAYYLLAQYNHDGYSQSTRWPIEIHGLQMRHKAMVEDWLHSTPALTTFNRTLAVELPPRYKELINLKTASILWMVENWLGSDKFHLALVKYINSRRGKIISLEDFMTQLDIETVECLHQFFNGSTSSQVLNSWFHQPGYPVVHVNVIRGRKPEAIELNQRKFSFTSDNRGESHYFIPVSYVVQNNENCYNCYRPRFTIDKTFTFKENLNGGWIILNRNASGYYRVNYDVVTWKLIAKTLRENHLSIDAQNRAQIVSDTFALYAAGEMEYSLAVEILAYLDKELSPMVWDSAVTGFELLKIKDAACGMTKYLYESWKEFMQERVTTVYHHVTSDIEQLSNSRLFRSMIIEFAWSVGHLPCRNDLRLIYNAYLDGKKRIDPDFRKTCYLALYENDANFGKSGFNSFEVEDKLSAKQKMDKENYFVFTMPLGEPLDRPQKLVSSTSLPTEPTILTSTVRATSTSKQAGTLNLASKIVLAITTAAIVAVR